MPSSRCRLYSTLNFSLTYFEILVNERSVMSGTILNLHCFENFGISNTNIGNKIFVTHLPMILIHLSFLYCG